MFHRGGWLRGVRGWRGAGEDGCDDCDVWEVGPAWFGVVEDVEGAATAVRVALEHHLDGFGHGGSGGGPSGSRETTWLRCH
jgi:hypothetical protein